MQVAKLLSLSLLLPLASAAPAAPAAAPAAAQKAAPFASQYHVVELYSSDKIPRETVLGAFEKLETNKEKVMPLLEIRACADSIVRGQTPFRTWHVLTRLSVSRSRQRRQRRGRRWLQGGLRAGGRALQQDWNEDRGSAGQHGRGVGRAQVEERHLGLLVV
eukprot:1249011-Prymnesium_polylepis.1